MESDDDKRSDIIDKMATAADITAGTVNSILNGDIDKPALPRLEGFAEALSLDFNALAKAAGYTDDEISERRAEADSWRQLEDVVNRMVDERIEQMQPELLQQAIAAVRADIAPMVEDISAGVDAVRGAATQERTRMKTLSQTVQRINAHQQRLTPPEVGSATQMQRDIADADPVEPEIPEKPVAGPAGGMTGAEKRKQMIAKREAQNK